MMMRFLKSLLGLLILPFCVGFAWQLGILLLSSPYRAEAPYYFISGALVYLAIHLIFSKPIFTYVIGHELTHGLFAVMFGGSVKSLQAGDRGGKVAITKSNFVITLAPYFFPLYAIAALMLYGAAVLAEANLRALNIIVLLTGAGFMFHIVLTFIFLRTDQTDISEHGAVFSYPIILLFNILFAGVIVGSCLVREMHWIDFFVGGVAKSGQMFESIVRGTVTLAGKV